MASLVNLKCSGQMELHVYTADSIVAKRFISKVCIVIRIINFLENYKFAPSTQRNHSHVVYKNDLSTFPQNTEQN